MTEVAAVDETFYAYWNDLLEGKKPHFFDGKLGGGVYAMKRGAARVPVRIDKVNGQICVWVSNALVTEGEHNKLWLACGRNAVSFEVYTSRMETGKWPDEAGGIAPERMAEISAIPDDKIDTSDIPEASPEFFATAGSNNPPPEALHELLPYTVAQIRAWLAKTAPFKTATELQIAVDHANAIRTLVSKVRKIHKTEKAPHLEACTECDRLYLHPANDADALVKTELARAVAAFEAIERNARAAEDAKARMAAQEEANRLVAAAQVAPPEKQIELLQQAAHSLAIPTAAPAPPTTVKSSTGQRGFTVKTVAIAKIADQDALYNAVKNYPEVAACLLKIAQCQLDSGTLLAGVERTEEVVAKR